MEPQNLKGIETLLTKYLEHICTQEEKQQLYKILSSDDNEEYFKEILFLHLNSFDGDQKINHIADSDRIYSTILSEIKHREIRRSEKRLLERKTQIRQLFIWGFAVAAVFFIAFFLGGIFKQSENKISTGPANAATYSEIKAPYGARTEIKLADGTQVMLNAGSTIKYRTDYNSGDRNIILDGEAYFKVAKNHNLPFVVNVGSINIKATGTEFNVKAYSDEEIIETTLIEGKVEISQKGDNDKGKMLELEPNQKAIFVKEDDRITLRKIKEIEPSAVKPAKVNNDKLLLSPKVDVDQVTAWTQNKLIIRGENLESLCIKLQRKYNVTFVFGNEEIKKYRFTGVLLDETLEQVLNVIKLTAPINYLLDGKVVLLISNEEQIENYSKHLKKYKK
jgi:ferric-dicitrate binding protein FerR (iron transport regulator)